MEDRLTLLTEFPIDNERLRREMAIAKKEISGASEAAEDVTARVNRKIVEAVGEQNAGVRQLDKSILQLQIRMQSYQGIVDKATDPRVIRDYNKRIQESQVEITRLRNVGKAGFDEMGNAIKRNTNLVGRLWTGISRLAYIIPGLGIAGIIGLALGPLQKLVKHLWDARKNVDELAKSQATLNKAFESNDYAKAVTAVNELRINLDLAKNGMADKKAVIDQYNKSVGAAAGEVTTLSGVEQGLIDNADNYVKMMLYKAAATAALEEASKHAVEAAKALAQTDDEAVPYILSGTQGMVNANTGKTMHEQAAENARTRQAAAEQKHVDTMLNIAEKFQKDAAKIAGEMGGLFLRANDGKSKKEHDKILRDRQRLLDQLATLETEYLRKSLTKDEQEVQSLRDKFAKIRQEVERFNADPKNKHIQIDIAGLAVLEGQALADLTYRQETDKLKAQLERQAELWRDYEEYKSETSEAHANERYAMELDKIKSFRADLESEVSALAMKRITTGLTGGEMERLTALDGLLRGIEDEEQAALDKYFAETLKAYQTFETKRQAVIEESNRAIATLMEKGRHEEADEARKSRDERLKKLIEEEISANPVFMQAMDSIDEVGTLMLPKALKLGVDTIRNLIAGLRRNNPELAKQLDELEKQLVAPLEKASEAAVAGNYHEVADLVGGFEQLVGLATQFDGTMGTALRTVGQMVSQVGNLSKSLGEAMGEIGGNVSKGGGYMAIVGAALSVFGTFVSISEQKWEQLEQRQQAMNDMQIKQLNATTRILERQLQLIQDIYGTERVTSYAKVVSETAKAVNDGLADVAGKTFALHNERNQFGTERFNQEFNGSMAELDAAIAESEKKAKNFWNILTGKSSTYTWDARALRQLRESILNGDTWSSQWSEIEDITAEEVLKIRELIEQGAFDEVTAAQLENILEQWEIWKDAMNQMREELTGVSFQGLTDGIVSMFEQGKTSVDDFTQFFEKQMQQAILRALSRQHIETQMQEWYEAFYAASESGGELTGAEVEELRAMYDSIIKNANARFEEMKAATGIGFDASGNSQASGLAGRIQSITQQQADVLAGQVGGIHMAVVEGLALNRARTTSVQEQTSMLRDSILYQMQIAENTKRTADNTDRLAAMQGHLHNIDKKMTSDVALRAAGR